MLQATLPGKLHRPIVLDLCFACQGIWFDKWESYQIAPEGIVELFRTLHEHRDDPRHPLSDWLCCPRCDEKLIKGLDVVKSGRFTYHRCPQEHGRFTIFGQFMIEKGFVRQLSQNEINTLAARIGTVNCTGCGAPVDIRTESACTHCRAPIAILDPNAVQQALENYADTQRRRIDDPLVLAETILTAERMESDRRRKTLDVLSRPLGDLVIAGAEVIWKQIRP